MTDRRVILTLGNFSELSDKVSAIKGVRVLNRMSLKSAKELVESLVDQSRTVLTCDRDIEEHQFQEGIQLIRNGGVGAQVVAVNTAATKAIGDELRKLVTHATMASQYDLSRALINVLETYCPAEDVEIEE